MQGLGRPVLVLVRSAYNLEGKRVLDGLSRVFGLHVTGTQVSLKQTCETGRMSFPLYLMIDTLVIVIVCKRPHPPNQTDGLAYEIYIDTQTHMTHSQNKPISTLHPALLRNTSWTRPDKLRNKFLGNPGIVFPNRATSPVASTMVGYPVSVAQNVVYLLLNGDEILLMEKYSLGLEV